MLDIILQNLINTGIGMLLFVGAYASNMAFSLWYNIKMLNQEFEKEKLINSGIKIAVFGVGTTLLVMVVTTLPLFADKVGFAIPAEYEEIFSNLVIVAVFLTSACRYAFEAYNKLKLVLFSDKNEENVSLTIE